MIFNYRFAYVSGSAGDTQTIENLGQIQTAQGPYVVMMSHPDVLQASRNIAPRYKEIKKKQ